MSKFGPVFSAIKPLFKEGGFRKSGNNFFRVSDAMLTVVNFQGSSDGGHFYVNVGSRPYEPVDGTEKPSGSDLRIASERIRLFSNEDGWLYEMSDVELGILSRKLTEQLGADQIGDSP